MRWPTVLLAGLLASSCAKATRVQPAPHVVAGVAAAMLQDEVERLIARHPRASWSIDVRALTTGEVLAAHRPEALLVPGSVLKVVTAATAAAGVGWDYTFRTSVEISGAVEEGVLAGDLVLRGTGDPSLEGESGPDLASAVAGALAGLGVRRITGRVIGDDAAVEEARPGLGWSWDDLGTASGVLAGALNASGNVVRLQVSPGMTVGAPVAVASPPDDPDFAVSVRGTTAPAGAPRTLWAERRPGEAALWLEGTLALDGGPVTLPVSAGNPTLWTARLVRSRLMRAGIQVDGPAVDGDDVPALPPARPLVEVTSAPLEALTRAMLKDSLNLHGEALLRLATGPSGPRDIAAALASGRDRLVAWGIPSGALQAVDGSGLSRRNLASASALVTVLARSFDGGSSPLVSALPVAGVDGTLAGRMRGTAAAGTVRAKTGTLTGVRSLAGYVTTADGEPLAFAILCNNHEEPAAEVLATIDALAVRLASFRR